MNKKAFSSFSRFAGFILIFSLTLVMAFQVIHAGHEFNCNEEDCPICLVLQIINTSKIIDQSLNVSFPSFINVFYIFIFILSAQLLVPATLVKQKIKLII